MSSSSVTLVSPVTTRPTMSDSCVGRQISCHLKLGFFFKASTVVDKGKKNLNKVFKERLHSTGSDMWATGCVFYTMLAGENPFKYTSMEETKNRVCAMDYFIPHYFSHEATAAVKLFLCEDVDERPSASEAFCLEIFEKYERRQTSSKPDQVEFCCLYMN